MLHSADPCRPSLLPMFYVHLALCNGHFPLFFIYKATLTTKPPPAELSLTNSLRERCGQKNEDVISLKLDPARCFPFAVVPSLVCDHFWGTPRSPRTSPAASAEP
uniref:Uncharacterized protein n=1 Tax=Accipiter nisus TaxID=211598 RepID=A0A8B9NEY8_9AVES